MRDVTHKNNDGCLILESLLLYVIGYIFVALKTFKLLILAVQTIKYMLMSNTSQLNGTNCPEKLSFDYKCQLHNIYIT